MTTATKTGKVYLNSVDSWLDTLPAADSDHFMEFADNCPSVIEIWVYAGVLEYPGTFNDLVRWVKMKYKNLIEGRYLIARLQHCILIFKIYVWQLQVVK